MHLHVPKKKKREYLKVKYSSSQTLYCRLSSCLCIYDVVYLFRVHFYRVYLLNLCKFRSLVTQYAPWHFRSGGRHLCNNTIPRITILITHNHSKACTTSKAFLNIMLLMLPLFPTRHQSYHECPVSDEIYILPILLRLL